MVSVITVTQVGVNHSLLSAPVSKPIPVSTIKDVLPNTDGDGFGNAIIVVDEGEDAPTKYINVTQTPAQVATLMNSAENSGNLEVGGNLEVEGTATIGGTLAVSGVSTLAGAVVTGNIITGETQTLTGAGAVSLLVKNTLLVTTGANALTLAAGTEGQTKFIRMKTDGGDGTLTVTNLQGGTTLTFNDAGDFVNLYYLDAKWHILTNSGATLA